MRIVVMGGTGHIGRLLVQRLEHTAQAVVVASPTTGVDALTGAGLDAALEHADAVVDVTNPRRSDADAAREFFTAATERLLAAERAAGVRHHLMLSIVGADRADDGYFAAKAAQEELIAESDVPFTILRSTQFFEFARAIAAWNMVDDTIHLPETELQPVAAADAATVLRALATTVPSGVIELAGPERMTLPQFVGRVLLADRDERFVVADPLARPRGFNIASRDLLPGEGALLGGTRLESWVRARPLAPSTR